MARPAISADIIRTNLSSGLTVPQIAKSMGFHPKSVWKACQRYGIAVPKIQRHSKVVMVKRRHVKPVAVPVRDVMIGVTYDDDPRASSPLFGSLPPRPFQWRSLG